MLYLNQKNLIEIGVDWTKTIDRIEEAISIHSLKDFAQPIKPYLRYSNPGNRIIAMPAYIGGEIQVAGIKWIASFPNNRKHQLPRAHSVTVLNEASTGVPFCIINSPYVSGIRTASVSGYVVRKYLEVSKKIDKKVVGIIGFGPIGQLHLEMIVSILGPRFDSARLFDINLTNVEKMPSDNSKIIKCNSWEEVYETSDILITCTTSEKRYIDKAPKKGSLQLNVSLRDYHPELRMHMDHIIVDDWDEVARENTDIELMAKKEGLRRDDVITLDDLMNNGFPLIESGEVTMFNPMGMAIFDIAIGNYFFSMGMDQKIGTFL